MKVAILAGGRGSRLAGLTEVVPKPMVQIGERPILWHIMKHYAGHGHTEFALALGYKGQIIKQFFLQYKLLSASLTVDLVDGRASVHEGGSHEDWKVHLIETGLDTGTGGRLYRMAPWLRDERFLLTYGDGVSNVDIGRAVEAHRASGAIVTITAVRPPSRFGGLNLESGLVTEFVEKRQLGEGWINGGFMVFEPSVFDYMSETTDSLEVDVLETIAAEGKLGAYCHDGFWQCMDTLRERDLLEQQWLEGKPAWKTWA